MKKVLVIGAGESISELLIQTFKEKHGNDIELFTPEQAKERGLTEKDFCNLPKLEIKNERRFEAATKVDVDFNFSKQRLGKGGRAKKRSSFNKGKWR